MRVCNEQKTLCQEQIRLGKREVKPSCGLSFAPGKGEVAMGVTTPRVRGVGVKEGSDLFEPRLRGIINVRKTEEGASV